MLLHMGAVPMNARRSALKVDSGRKIPGCTRESNPHKYCAWFCGLMLYQMSYPTPNTWIKRVKKRLNDPPPPRQKERKYIFTFFLSL